MNKARKTVSILALAASTFAPPAKAGTESPAGGGTAQAAGTSQKPAVTEDAYLALALFFTALSALRWRNDMQKINRLERAYRREQRARNETDLRLH